MKTVGKEEDWLYMRKTRNDLIKINDYLNIYLIRITNTSTANN